MVSGGEVRFSLTGSGVTQRSTRSIINRLQAGTFPEPDQRALLDALGHSPDCVAPDHYRRMWQAVHDRAERAKRAWQDAEDRAERAERDLEVSRKPQADADTQRAWERAWSPAPPAPDGEDADAEPEPSRPKDCGKQLGCIYDPPCQRHGDPDRQEMLRQLDVALHGETWARPTSPSLVWRDLLGEVVSVARRRGEPSRAEGDERCHACDGDGDAEDPCGRTQPRATRRTAPHERKNVVCLDCLCADHEDVAEHLEEVQVINGGVTVVLRPVQTVDHATGRHPSDAEGGRPREADPQGTPSGNGDASVDGGGDDGRSRAIKAAMRSDPDPDCHYGIPRLRSLVARAIDDALASGDVVTAEDVRTKIDEEHIECAQSEARVRELEAALRPFAEFLDALDVHGGYDPPDGWLVRIGSDPPITLAIEELHRARAALGGVDRA